MNISRRPHWQPNNSNPNKDFIEQTYRRTSLIQAPALEGLRPGEGVSLTGAKPPASMDDKVEFKSGLVVEDHPEGGVAVKLTDGSRYHSPGELEVDDHHVRIRFEIQDQHGQTEQWRQELDNNGSVTLRGGNQSSAYVSFDNGGEPRYFSGVNVATRQGNALALEGESRSSFIVPPVPPEQFFA